MNYYTLLVSCFLAVSLSKDSEGHRVLMCCSRWVVRW